MTGTVPPPAPLAKRPRELAVRVIGKVLSDQVPLDETLAAMSEDARLDAAGRAWLLDVCAGTLRWKGRIDSAIDSLAHKKKPTGWLRRMLLVASYQLIAQDRVQPAKVVDETVAAIKREEGEAPANFANAVLRKIADQAKEWREMKLPAQATQEEAAAWASMPVWLWGRIEKQHGRTWAQEFAQSALQRPVTWLRTRTPDWQADWASPGPIPCSYGIVGGGSLTERTGFQRGDFIVQDISSQVLVNEISSAAKAHFKSKSLLGALDLCASPGGKSIGLAWTGQFKVVASDREDSRMALLRDSVKRSGAPVRVLEPDHVSDAGAQELVWVDAPCTGTGIIRRHPDVRWIKSADDLKGLQSVQQNLIRRGWEYVKPGGLLAYSVCSVLKDEGIQAVSDAGLRAFLIKEFTLAPHLPPGGDGFWACLIQKPQV